MTFCECGHYFTDHYQTDVEYLCLLCGLCDGYTKAAANISATAPVPAGGTPEGLAREKVEMTDSEVKSSPTTEAGGLMQGTAEEAATIDRAATQAGKDLLFMLGTHDADDLNMVARILAIEQQAREGGYSSGFLEGRREAVREYAPLVAAIQDYRDDPRSMTPIYRALDRVAGLEGEGRSPIGSNASEPPPTRFDKQRLALAVQTVHDYDDDYEAVEEADEIAAAYASELPPIPKVCQCGHTREQHESHRTAPGHCTHRCLPPWLRAASESPLTHWFTLRQRERVRLAIIEVGEHEQYDFAYSAEVVRFAKDVAGKLNDSAILPTESGMTVVGTESPSNEVER